MRLLEINLATRPFRNNTLYWAGLGSAALALAVISLLNVWLFFGHGSAMRLQREEFTTKQSKRDELARDEQRLSLKLTRLDFKGLSQQSEFANDAIRKRSFSWTRLFNRLEEVVPPSVMMTALRPEIQADGISVVAEGLAKDQEALLTFEESLIKNRHFARIYPGSERREQKGQDLRFSLKFDYVPEGRSDFVPSGPEPKEGTKPEAPPPAKREAASSVAEVAHPVPVTPPPAPPSKAPDKAPAAPPSAPGLLAKEPPPTGAPSSTAGKPSPQAAAATPPSAPRPAPTAGPMHPFSTIPDRRLPPTRAGRPPLKVGSQEARKHPPPPDGAEAQKKAEEAAAARFANQPVQDVIDYLMKTRSMTFVFAGDFDFRQKVTMDLNDQEEEGALGLLCKSLDCVFTREGPHAFRLSPKSGGEPLEEPPVDEEPAPTEGGGGDSGSEPPP